MNKYSAQRKATSHWARLGITFVTIRHKSVTDRFEVGYWSKERVVMGAGPTWEIAFDRALKGSPGATGDQTTSPREEDNA